MHQVEAAFSAAQLREWTSAAANHIHGTLNPPKPFKVGAADAPPVLVAGQQPVGLMAAAADAVRSLAFAALQLPRIPVGQQHARCAARVSSTSQISFRESNARRAAHVQQQVSGSKDQMQYRTALMPQHVPSRARRCLDLAAQRRSEQRGESTVPR